MFWNNGKKYIDYKMNALQASGWEVSHPEMIKASINKGLSKYVITRGQERVVMTFNKKGQVIQFSGSRLKEFGFNTYSHPFDEVDEARFMSVFRAL
jgi:hypothetical protein